MIVTGVPNCDVGGAGPLRRPHEELVTRPMSGVFNRDALPARERRHSGRLDDTRQIEPIRQRPAETLVLIRRRRTELMVEVGDPHEMQRPMPSQFRQQTQQRDRVSAARHGDQHPALVRDQILPANRREHLLGQQLHRAHALCRGPPGNSGPGAREQPGGQAPHRGRPAPHTVASAPEATRERAMDDWKNDGRGARIGRNEPDHLLTKTNGAGAGT